MRKLLLPFYLFTFIPFLASCGGKHDTFLIEGTFKGFNQGELYIYGTDGSWPLDTIGVAQGKFRYAVPIDAPTVFVLVFPNFTELPVYGRQGAEVTISGDASHLREAKITGTTENEQMTSFRQKTSEATPPEYATAVAKYVKDNPASPFAPYLIQKTFLQSPQPDYQQAADLISAVQQANPDAPRQGDLIRRLKGIAALKDGSRLPAFSATDLNGRTVTDRDLNAPVNAILVWSSWNYESQNIMRALQRRYDQNPGDIKVIAVCIDADVKDCRRRVMRDSVKWSTVCNGKLWDSPILQATGLAHVPDNIITDASGKIIAHGLQNRDFMLKIESLLPKKKEQQ